MRQDNDERPTSPARRRMMTGIAVAAGAVAGLAGGVAIAGASAPTVAPQVNGLRRFDGQVVAITGATSGIGRAAALAFAREGARVAFCGRREGMGNELAERIRGDGGEATFIRTDVRSEEEVESFISRTLETYGALHVALNNAGVSFSDRLHDSSLDDFENLHATNVRGVFLAMRAELRHMISAGGGQIIVTASANIAGGRPNLAAYTASKRAVSGLVHVAAMEYAGDNIRVNAICPGVTNTEMVRRQAGMMDAPDGVWNAGIAAFSQSAVHALKRPAQPDEIANAILAMASPEMAYMTGSMVFVDGGMSASL